MDDFVELKRTGNSVAKEPLDTLTLSKGVLTINSLAIKKLGMSNDVSIHVDPKNNKIKITPDGAFHISRPGVRGGRVRHFAGRVSCIDLRILPSGRYVATEAPNVYQHQNNVDSNNRRD